MKNLDTTRIDPYTRATILANQVESDLTITALQRPTIHKKAVESGLQDPIIPKTGEQPWRVESLVCKILVEQRGSFRKVGKHNNRDTYIRIEQ